MITFFRLPKLCGIIIIALSLVYLSMFGPSVAQSRFTSDYLWHDVSGPLRKPFVHTEEENHSASTYHASASYSHSRSRSHTTTTISNLDATTPVDAHIEATLIPPEPSGSNGELSMGTTDSGCHSTKPNLILSAVDGPRLQDQIFIFLQSLDVALGEELLASQRRKSCPPAPVHVHILVPLDFMEEIPTSFKAFMYRYPSLELVPALPSMSGVNVVLRRFKAWSEYLGTLSDQYGKALVSDLDVVFQRNPFAMPIETGVELLFFAEWRGLKIGQCSVHLRWFDRCVSSGAISRSHSSKYMPLDRICAGSAYGTARAMKTYLDMMAEQLEASSWSCNDQAMHIHIYYSGLLDAEMERKGVGKVFLVPNEEALLGTIGTTPMVRFNEWGEMLNERGHVQHAIHQFKTHERLSHIVWSRYGWMTPVGMKDAIPPPPELIGEVRPMKPGAAEHQDSQTELKRYLLADVSTETCSGQDKLCSCRNYDCQLHYEWF